LEEAVDSVSLLSDLLDLLQLEPELLEVGEILAETVLF
jgi:hypothetical protein